MNVLHKLKTLAPLVLSLFFSNSIFAQVQTYSLTDNLHPVTPTAFQFVKYTELPVSKYTGIPNISIPLYEIDEDGVKIPLSLTYHAGGIRVNEEASWVGLGWDMQVGSIVQQINDQDDFAVSTHTQPDYYNTSQPIEFPFKLAYCLNPLLCNFGCDGPIEIATPLRAEGFVIYTQDIAPFNGVYSSPNLAFFSDHHSNSIDSEPDIFTANFAGHSFKFVLDWSTGTIDVLDKKGYKVTHVNSNLFTVIVPSGEEYDFALKNTVQTLSSSDGASGTGMSGGSSTLQPSSIIWLLTRIVTKNHKIITLNYNVPSQPYNVYPSFAEKTLIPTLQTTIQTSVEGQWQDCRRGTIGDGVTGTYTFGTRSYSQEKYITLSSIVFPKGQVSFITDTNRNDLLGGAKLDSISVTASQQVKSYKLNYGYFDASSVSGNTYNVLGSVSFGSHTLYRLKLTSLQDNSGATHTFTYNGTQLPAKNSFAMDYWGFYNGHVANTTAVPNASQFVNSALSINESALGNNGDNHSANATYAQACMLQQIKYPTGGSVNFNYELNQFNNYWVPDFSSSTNTISSGDGLRIQATTFLDGDGSQLKKTTYSYAGGLAILPVSMFRNYTYSLSPGGNLTTGVGSPVLQRIYTMNEINMTGFFSSNPFASINGVGYSAVTQTDVDASNNPNGKEVSNFYNNPDQTFNSTVESLSQVDASLPAYKNNALPENGSLQSDIYYDQSNNPLKKITNSYFNVNSNLYYGARVFGFGSLLRWTPDATNPSTYDQVIIPQNLVGYYPIFDFETLLSTSTETDYFGTDSVTVNTSNTYDAFNQLTLISKGNSTVGESTNFTYPYNITGNTVLDTLVARNRLTDVVEVDHFGASPYLLSRTYAKTGQLVVPSQDVVTIRPTGTSTPNAITTYDQYDISNGNILQYTKNSLTGSFIYDYNKEYVIAEVKNAPYNSIAYTSFEADGKGRWKYSGSTLPDNTAPTGKQDYSLANGSIFRDSLNTSLTYVVSYWSKNGAQSVNGNTTPLQGYTYNGWTYYEHQIANPSGGTVTVSGSGTIDELRLYPNNAQMSTYTYEPLVGINSLSDPAGKISYYEYDGSKRLLYIRDQSRNILKAYCYNYAGQSTGCPIVQPSTSQTVNTNSYVTSNVIDNEWKQEAPPGYTIAADNGTTINAAGTAGSNAGRFAYFSTGGTVSPLTYINGNLSFTAKGSGTIDVQLIATYNTSIVYSHTFNLTSTYQNFSWDITNLYPQLEMMVGVIVNGGNSSSQASVQFQNNFNLNLTQNGITGAYTRFRADSTSLIGNAEKDWYGWNDNYNTPRKKYLQHSAYSRMRFKTSANKIAIEYVRDFYDKRVVNLFAQGQTQSFADWDGSGNIVAGGNAINNYTQVTAGQTYTISGLLTTNPSIVWFNGSSPIAAPVTLTNVGTSLAPLYQVTAPSGATNMGLLVQTASDAYTCYTNCMIQQGAIGTATPLDGTIPSPFVTFAGYVPSHVSGPAVFINGVLYKYYQVEGNDLAKVIQFVTDTLPAGYKTVEVMMPGEGTYLPADPHVRRSGTYLRAVYFPGSTTTVSPSAETKPGSILYIHDSILSGYNISSDAQNNVWMMKTLRDPTYGFKGDIFSEGYAGRILYTDISTPTLTAQFANKLAAYGVDKFWFQIGVNDYGFVTPLNAFYVQYKSLVEQLKALRPSAKIYIQSVGPESYEGPNAETYADDGLTTTGPAANDFRDVQRAIATSHSYCEYVNFEGLFSPVIANLSDGIHPTDAGNILYANGIKDKSTLLGTVQTPVALAFYRSSSRHMVQTLPGIFTITATGGSAPYTFTLMSGTLPSGLTFNADGTITGAPSANGTSTLSVKVTDATTASVAQTFSLVVDPVPAITVSPGTIPFILINTATSIKLSGANGYGPYILSLSSGSVPTGMTFNATTGVLSGTPTTAGTYTFTISATDHWGFTGSTSYSLNILTSPPTENFTLNATVNSAGHLIVTGHLPNTNSQTLFTFIAAYYTQGGTEFLLNGANVNVAAGNTSSDAIDFGCMTFLQPGSFTVRLNNLGIFPSSIDGANIAFPTDTSISLVGPTPTGNDSFTVTSAITDGHLIVTANLAAPRSTDIDSFIGATYAQNGTQYFFGSGYGSGEVIIPAGSTSSTPIDFGPMTSLTTGTITIDLHNYGIFPTIMDYINITYLLDTINTF